MIRSFAYLTPLFCIRADTLVFEGVEVTGYQIFEDPKVLNTRETFLTKIAIYMYSPELQHFYSVI